MNYQDITVLCLWNPWKGGYQCFDVFNQEIISALDQMHVHYLTAHTPEEAVRLYQTNRIDFSFCIGQYCFFYNNIPLYDYFHVVNYEWVIDNPFKYSENTVSPYHRLIMIDDEFHLMPGFDRADYLTLSLGIPEESYSKTAERIPAVLVPWKIKKLSVLESNIAQSDMREQLFDFIDHFDYDASYIRALTAYFRTHEIADQISFFMLSNDYIRLKKRIDMLSAIRNYPIVIASDEKIEELNNANISYVPKGNFLTTLALQKQYRYVLNNNPNYDMCLHDRVGHAVSNGAAVVSDRSSLLKKLDFPLTVPHSQFSELDQILYAADDSAAEIAAVQDACTKEFRMKRTMEKLIQHYQLWTDKTY